MSQARTRRQKAVAAGVTVFGLLGAVVAASVASVSVAAAGSTAVRGNSSTFTNSSTVQQASAVSSVPQSRRPNVVMFMADDMRNDDLVYMPKLRRLVKKTGVQFENSFAPYPLCCPARASFLTGKAAHNHGVLYHDDPYGFGAFDDSRTIATALRRSGYQTGFLGKYLNGYGTARSKVSGRASAKYVPNGWDQWYASVERPRGAWWSGSTYAYFNTPYNRNGRIDASHKGEYSTNTLGKMTRRMTGAFHQSRKPFFVFSSFVAPHFGGPREADDPADMKTPARPNWVKGRFDSAIRHASGMPKNGGPSEADVSDKPEGRFTQPEMTRAERRGLTEVTRQRAEALFVLDQQVGRTVAHLKQINEWSNTVFIFTSDNGYYLGEHRQRQGKVTAHEPSLRVPLLMTGPGLGADVSRYDPITTMDLTATIADMANATSNFPWVLDGRSLLPTLRAGDRGWDRPVLTEALYGSYGGQARRWAPPRGEPFMDQRGSIGIRMGNWKLTMYRGGAKELYQLAVDPHEMNSLHGDPEFADIRNAMIDLWWQYKDCKGAACTAPVPAELASTPAENRAVTTNMTASRIARYGH